MYPIKGNPKGSTTRRRRAEQKRAANRRVRRQRAEYGDVLPVKGDHS